MRIIFAGTPAFAAVALQRLAAQGHEIGLVLTQPDRPSGRGLRSIESPVKKLAGRLRLEIQQPSTLRHPGFAATLASVRADLGVVAAYGLILPPDVLSIPRLGWINIHASLLPRWRGAAPIQRAIMAGDTETGICIMQMEAGLDTGPLYECERTPIAPEETAGTLHDRLSLLGAVAVCRVLDRLSAESLVPTPQSADGITYATKILRADTYIRWEHSAAMIERQLRALDPSPGAYTEWKDEPLKIWHGRLAAGSSAVPGMVLAAEDDGLLVACGEGSLRITELQRAGGRRMSAAEFQRGSPIAPGLRLGLRPLCG